VQIDQFIPDGVLLLRIIEGNSGGTWTKIICKGLFEKFKEIPGRNIGEEIFTYY
jgi:hypothetical protein